jgi:hypothetical protein
MSRFVRARGGKSPEQRRCHGGTPAAWSRIMTYPGTCVAIAFLALAAPVRAASNGPEQVTTEVSHPRRVFALTISPLHLASPIVELTGEVRALDKLGVAVIAGAGKISADATPTTPKISAAAYEAGLSVRYYLLGDFRHGLQLGAEALYIHVSDEIETVSASAKGLAVGPFAGYKYTTDIGFTFDGQLGFQRVGLIGEAHDATTATSHEESKFIPLLNLNVGWSF